MTQTIVTKDNGKRELSFNDERLRSFMGQIMSDFPQLDYASWERRNLNYVTSRDRVSARDITNTMILNAMDNVTTSVPEWTFVAARIYLRSLYRRAAYNRSHDASDKYGSFYGLLKTLGSMGVYSEDILREYSKEEIDAAGRMIDPERDKLFTYPGLYTLVDRYLAKSKDGGIYELPQERFLVIAMTLMMKENPKQRMELVEEAYWALSNQYMTVATPTFLNAGRPEGQYSSCFIDLFEDSLQGIFDSTTDVANLSKNAGGIAVYLGKIRSRGSDIRGYKGVSSGVISWGKILNNVAVSVDQLGARKGAIAVYLDVWHKDIFLFLDSKLNHGDERDKLHDLFLGVSLPDLFMERVESRGDWYLFDPHEVRRVMGYSLEDFYDEHDGAGTFREKYDECVRCDELTKVKVPAIEIMKSIMQTQLETGTPYMFYRDEVNRKNPNKHEGMIYSSNLCTEIAQNMSPTTMIKQEISDEGEVIISKDPGDMVVCNLSSIHLGNVVKDDVLERLIPIQVRMLDNVISVNNLPVLQAKRTSERYRAVGLGTFSWHQVLAESGIKWESDEAVQLADHLYEYIAYLAIRASSELAKEKGAYPLFSGSDWSTGSYFSDRGYFESSKDGEEGRFVTSEDWEALAEKVAKHGIRNGYLIAIAPNASTSILANGTASTDPVYSKLFYEEKKDYKFPIVAPNITPENMWFYSDAHNIDQQWSIKHAAARQKHIDQSQSVNFYVSNEISGRDLLDLHLNSWKQKLKTTYYIRSRSVDIEDCDVCQ